MRGKRGGEGCSGTTSFWQRSPQLQGGISHQPKCKVSSAWPTNKPSFVSLCHICSGIREAHIGGAHSFHCFLYMSVVQVLILCCDYKEGKNGQAAHFFELLCRERAASHTEEVFSVDMNLRAVQTRCTRSRF